MLDRVSDEQKAWFLDELLKHYVERQGLGAMPKADLDALIIHLYLKVKGAQKVDSFALAETFRIKEGRVKSLVETAWLKFEEREEAEVWEQLLTLIATAAIELESLEKGQIRYKLENPAHFRYIQKQVRILGSTTTYSPRSEQVVMPFTIFGSMINRVFEKVLGDRRQQSVQTIQTIYSHIRNDIIGPERFEQYRTGDKMDTPLGRSLAHSANLSQIGAFVLAGFGDPGATAAVATGA